MSSRECRRENVVDRRTALGVLGGGVGALAVGGSVVAATREVAQRTSAHEATASLSIINNSKTTETDARRPNSTAALKQSVCRWCYGRMDLETLCRNASEMGFQSVELLGEKEWQVPMKYDMTCAVANGPNPIPRGWNRVENHDAFVKESERLLPLIAEAGIPNMIVFSGNRGGMKDKEGIANCIKGLKRITPLAEQLGVTVIMELLNSRVDHKDYHADRTWWGVKVCEGVGSDRFKLLYDIYHMQIMEGDVIRTIRDNKDYLAHFHTGGNPGRAEIDDSQELNYQAICKAIVETGYTGYLGQEFIPRRDPMTSLRAAHELCDV